MKSDLNTQLLTKVNELSNTMKQLRQLKNSKLSMIDPNSGQGKVLNILKQKNPLPQRELVNKLTMKRQSVSELILKLEKKGYLVRKKSETDRRLYMIFLTEKGIEAASRISLAEAKHFDVLSEDQKNQFGEILDKLIASFNQEKKIAEENFGINLFGKPHHKNK